MERLESRRGKKSLSQNKIKNDVYHDNFCFLITKAKPTCLNILILVAFGPHDSGVK